MKYLTRKHLLFLLSASFLINSYPSIASQEQKDNPKVSSIVPSSWKGKQKILNEGEEVGAAPSRVCASSLIGPSLQKKQAPKKFKKKTNLQKAKVDNRENKQNQHATSSHYSISKPNTPKTLKKIRAQVETFEESGNFLAASQEMDRFLKMTSAPTLEDLCYALDLNRRAPLIKQRQNRPQQLATLIANHLKIDSQATDIYFQKYSWQQFWPYLDYLIAETAEDPTYEIRNFRYKLEGQDIYDHLQWILAHMRSYKYPIGISDERYGTEGNKSAEGVWDIYHEGLTINNYTQKENQSRDSFAYHFYGGTLDTTRLDQETFYNLIVRAGFKEEDFEKGEYGFQDKILVKPFLLNKDTLEQCYAALKEEVASTLEKAKHPYVTFVFELRPDASFSVNELFSYNNGTLFKYFFEELQGPAATIIEDREKRLYFCFHNVKQTILDLHKTSSLEALNKVQEFMVKRYNNFEEECTIITGRGNHVNSNGATGILHQAFKQWAKKELKPYIKTYIPFGKDGGYKIILRKPTTLLLTRQPFEVHLEKATASILKADQANDKRLIITHQQAQSDIYFYTLASKAFLKLAQQHSFSPTHYLKNAENGIYLTWKDS